MKKKRIAFIFALPIIVLNLSLHAAIQKVDPTAGSSGLKQTIISSILVTPVEAALLLPAINLTIATKRLRRGGPPPNKSRLQGRFAPGRPNGRPSLKRYEAEIDIEL